MWGSGGILKAPGEMTTVPAFPTDNPSIMTVVWCCLVPRSQAESGLMLHPSEVGSRGQLGHHHGTLLCMYTGLCQTDSGCPGRTISSPFSHLSLDFISYQNSRMDLLFEFLSAFTMSTRTAWNTRSLQMCSKSHTIMPIFIPRTMHVMYSFGNC